MSKLCPFYVRCLLLLPAWSAVFEVPVVLTVGTVHGLSLLVGGADPGQVSITVLVSLTLVSRTNTPHHGSLVLHPLSHLDTTPVREKKEIDKVNPGNLLIPPTQQLYFPASPPYSSSNLS